MEMLLQFAFPDIGMSYQRLGASPLYRFSPVHHRPRSCKFDNGLKSTGSALAKSLLFHSEAAGLCSISVGSSSPFFVSEEFMYEPWDIRLGIE